MNGVDSTATSMAGLRPTLEGRVGIITGASRGIGDATGPSPWRTPLALLPGQGHVQASVLGRMQMGELAPDLKCLRRPARHLLGEDEGAGPGHRCTTWGLAHPGKLERTVGELSLQMSGRVCDRCACGRGPITCGAGPSR
jgi:hypothetical protein